MMGRWRYRASLALPVLLALVILLGGIRNVYRLKNGDDRHQNGRTTRKPFIRNANTTNKDGYNNVRNNSTNDDSTHHINSGTNGTTDHDNPVTKPFIPTSNDTSIMNSTTIYYYYSTLRRDRCGSAIQDMLMAHAHAFSLGIRYGGACGVSKYKKDVESMIETLGLERQLPLKCPPKNNNSHHIVLEDNIYRIPDGQYFTTFTKSWISYLKKESMLSNPSLHQEGASSRNETQQQWYQEGTSSRNETLQQQQHVIAVHIRRGDVVPCQHKQRYLPNSHYMSLIQKYYQENSKVVIYSEKQSYESLDEFAQQGYILKIDESLESTWKGFMDSDVFILSKSSFSYVPAVLAKGVVVYTEFWHKPLSWWHVADQSIMNQTLAELAAMCAKIQCAHKKQQHEDCD